MPLKVEFAEALKSLSSEQLLEVFATPAIYDQIRSEVVAQHIEKGRELTKVMAAEILSLAGLENNREDQHINPLEILTQDVNESLGKANVGFGFYGCCDSRAETPAHLVQAHVSKEMRQAFNISQSKPFIFCHYFPTIGAGVPDENMVRELLAYYQQHGISTEKIVIVSAQHGSTTEVTECLDGGGCNHPTCGARHVLAEFPEILDIRNKPEQDWPAAAQQLASELLERTKLGKNQGADISPRLILHLVKTARSSDLVENARKVGEELRSFFPGVRVFDGVQDHNSKIVRLLNPESDQDMGAIEFINGTSPWEKPTQNPSFVIVSYGKKLPLFPHGLVFPNSVNHKHNNDFRGAAVPMAGDTALEKCDKLWDTLSEMTYPAGFVATRDENVPEEERKSFSSTKGMIILVENAADASDVKELLASEEFNDDVGMRLAQAFAGISLVRVDDPTQSEFVVFEEYADISQSV